MNDAIYRFGSLSIYGFGLLATLAYLWGSFVFYKKAIESHLEEFHILDGVVMSAFWAFIAGRLLFVLANFGTFWNHFSRIFLFSNFPGIDRWGVIIGIYLGAYWTIRRVRAKVLDWFDLVSLGILSGISIFFAGLSILVFSWQYFLLGLVHLSVFVFAWGAEEKYRTYAWYKSNKTSAKSGLITGFSISAWGILSILEIICLSKFNWVGVMWGVTLFVGGIVLVYIRSGRTAKDDIKIIFKHGRK